MKRLQDLKKYVDLELDKLEDTDKRNSGIVHLYGVSQAITVIAKKRGLDIELAYMAALLHDLYAYKNGSYDDHAHKGAELARQVLCELGITDSSETDIICSAIYHHDDNFVSYSPMDEALKDADLIQNCIKNLSQPLNEAKKARFEKLCDEFGLN
jgi:uncharacterized protein